MLLSFTQTNHFSTQRQRSSLFGVLYGLMRANISYIGTTKVLSSPNDMFISPYQTLGECLVCSYCELLHKFFWIIFGFSSFLFICLFFYNFFSICCLPVQSGQRYPGFQVPDPPQVQTLFNKGSLKSNFLLQLGVHSLPNIQSSQEAAPLIGGFISLHFFAGKGNGQLLIFD